MTERTYTVEAIFTEKKTHWIKVVAESAAAARAAVEQSASDPDPARCAATSSDYEIEVAEVREACPEDRYDPWIVPWNHVTPA